MRYEPGEVFRIRLALHEQCLSRRRDMSRDPLAELHPSAFGMLVPVGARDHEIVPFHQHHGAAVAVEELHGTAEHRVQDDGELESVIHRLPGAEQELDLPEAIGERGRQHAFVDQEPRELAKVAFLLDGVRAERDAEQHDRDPHDRRGNEESRRARLPGRYEHDTEGDRDQEDRGQDPELQPPPLDGLEGGRVEVTQAGHTGFPPDPFLYLVLILRHPSGSSCKHRKTPEPS